MLFVALSVVDGHKSHLLSLPVIIAAVSIVASSIAVMIFTFVIHHRCTRHKLPIRDRIVSMHNNALYLQDNADKSVKNGPMYNVSRGSTTAPLLARLMPRINGQMTRGLASLSEYEIPLDKKWEFPRTWYVKGISVVMSDYRLYACSGCNTLSPIKSRPPTYGIK